MSTGPLAEVGEGAPVPRGLGVGTHLLVRIGREHLLAQSALRHLHGPHLVISAPVRVLGGSPVPAPAPSCATVVLFWEGPLGRYELPGELSQKDAGSWWVRPTGRVQTQQRRDAVRVPVRLPVTIVSSVQQLVGHVLDLSESGFRAHLQEELPPMESAVAYFTLNAVDLALPVTLLRCAAGEAGTWNVAGHFDHTARDADVIRRFVFARQRQALKGPL